MKKSSVFALLGAAVLSFGIIGCAKSASSNEVKVGVAYAAAHGTKCFTIAAVAVKGDVIVDAYIDDFQFGGSDAPVVAVPNSDKGFGKGYAEGKILYSKRANAEYYSANMTKAGATIAIDANFDAIQAKVAGMKIADVEKLATRKDVIDAVSGATLVDTAGYLKAIVAAAKSAGANLGTGYDGDVSALKLNVVYGAAHGDKCFSMAAVVTGGDKIISTYIDEYQFMDKTDSLVAVPNSDKDFGKDYAEGKALASKMQNAALYSSNMKVAANSTVSLDENYKAIQAAVNGKPVSDAEAIAAMDNKDAVDAVSGATLVDTKGYVSLIVEAAKK